MGNSIGNIKEKNNFAFICLQEIKDNIIKGKKPLYNPVCMFGLSKEDRFKIFFRFFNKDFNRIHKGRYVSCKNIKLDESFDINKDIVILEEIDVLVGNNLLQEKVIKIINECLEKNIPMILCLNENPENLMLKEQLKCRLTWGISFNLK